MNRRGKSHQIPVTLRTKSESGSEGPMEDVVGCSDRAVWVIDGTTALGDQTLTNAPSDGAWYVREFERALQSRVDNVESPLPKIIKDSIAIVSRRFEAEVDRDVEDSLLEPAAAISLVRWYENRLEYFVLGDCSIIFKSESGDIQPVLGEGPRKYDKEIIKKIEALMQNGKSHSTAVSHIQQQLKENRRLKNTPEGYWTLGFSEDAVSHATTGKKALTDWPKVYLLSDGFEAIVTVYEEFDDWKEATSYIDDHGIEAAFNRLRDIEQNEDPECKQYPRLKQSDDASIAVVSFNDSSFIETTNSA